MKKYILATKEESDECRNMALAWFNDYPIKGFFGGYNAIAALSEYIANWKGLTLYTETFNKQPEVQ